MLLIARTQIFIGKFLNDKNFNESLIKLITLVTHLTKALFFCAIVW